VSTGPDVFVTDHGAGAGKRPGTRPPQVRLVPEGYVDEYSVGARSRYGGKCFVTVRGLFDELETACGEQFSRRSAELLAVVSNQNPVGHLMHSWWAAVLAAIW